MIQRCMLIAALMFLSSACRAGISDRITFSSQEVTAVERQFFAELGKGRLSRFTEADAFLIASGITGDAAFRSYQRKFDAIRRQAAVAVKDKGDAAARGRALLEWLHTRVFKKYNRDASTADKILDRGEFNCLASSVFYAIIAADLGIPVEGLLVPDHALCVVTTAAGPVEVETGIRAGFNISGEGIRELQKATGISYSRKTPRARVTVFQLAGEVYANRASLLAGAGRDETQCMQLYKKALYFNPSSTFFFRNLSACLNNRAIDALEHKRYDEARNYISQGRRLDPADQNAVALDMDWYTKMADADASRGRYQDAVNRVKEGLRAYPGSSGLRQALARLYINWSHGFSVKERHDTAIQILTAARRDVPDDTTISYNLNTAFYNKAVQCYNTKYFKEAISACEQGLAMFPKDARLLQLRQSAAEAATR